MGGTGDIGADYFKGLSGKKGIDGNNGESVIIKLNGGTIIANVISCGDSDDIVEITGGSINASMASATNGDVMLVQVTVQFIVFNTRLDNGAINGAEYYSLCGVKTDDDGKIYLWLPQNVIDNGIIINDVPAYAVT